MLSKSSQDPVVLRNNIDNARGQLGQLSKAYAELEAKTVELRASSEISRYQSAQTEAQLKKQILDQQIQGQQTKLGDLASQISQARSIVFSRNNDLQNYINQQNGAISGLVLMRQQLAAINLAETQQELDYVQQAKEAKPSRTTQALQLQEAESKLQVAIGELWGENKLRQGQLNERERLQGLGNNVECPSCGTLVTAEHLREETVGLKAELAESKRKIDEKTAELQKIQSEQQFVRQKLTLIDQYLAKEARLEQIKENHRRLSENIATTEAGLQSFDAAIAAARRLLAEAQGVEQDLVAKEVQLRAVMEQELLPYREAWNLAQKVANDLASGATGAQTALTRLLTEQGVAKQSLDQKILEIGRLENQVAEAESSATRLSKLRTDLGVEQSRLNRLKILEQMYGVDGVQTSIVEKYLPLLNSYLNEYIDIVGGGKIHVAIVTDGKRDGKVDLVITGQCATQSVRLSGGEKVKVRLAISIALGLLAFARNQEVPEFICLDEIIAPVDDLTKEHIFAMLAKLQEHFRTIMVISHDKSLQAQFPHEVLVNRVRGVSRIEKQFWEPQAKASPEVIVS
jgi:chromosome segregation ATPase